MANTRKPTQEEKTKIATTLRQMDPNYTSGRLQDLEPVVVKTRSSKTPVQLILELRERKQSLVPAARTRPVSLADHKAQLRALKANPLERLEGNSCESKDLQEALGLAEARLLATAILLKTPLGILETLLDQVAQNLEMPDEELARIRRNLGV